MWICFQTYMLVCLHSSCQKTLLSKLQTHLSTLIKLILFYYLFYFEHTLLIPTEFDLKQLVGKINNPVLNEVIDRVLSWVILSQNSICSFCDQESRHLLAIRKNAGSVLD